MILFAAAVLVFMGEGTSAQDAGTVAGTVTIVGSQEGVPGVRIHIPGLTLSGITDDQGRFQLGPVPAGRHEIRAELVGCRPLSWTLDGPVAGGVRLWLDGPAVTAVMAAQGSVAAGVASATRETVLPFSVEFLDREQLAHDPAPTIADLIRGAFPGVKVVQGSGAPGSSLSLQFRGPGSISGSQEPLVVVDGLITGGGLDGLDPYDVERVEVLKGSAAAALYGARGQAGVVEITTKSGAAADEDRCFIRRERSS
ncbi:MAG: TonB-dependent receptor plug domain-containing protein [Longimicrobiales bacterium]|nr:TonB-dependent receptor plug domain-containing protein [Longimicrobiales bacterium]